MTKLSERFGPHRPGRLPADRAGHSARPCADHGHHRVPVRLGLDRLSVPTPAATNTAAVVVALDVAVAVANNSSKRPVCYGPP